MKILIIRPQPGANASANRAQAMGFETVVLPFFEVGPVPWTVPDPALFDALLISSANAIRHAGPALQALKMLPVYAVGERTASAAMSANLYVAAMGNAGIEATAAAAMAEGYKRLLWLAGEERTTFTINEGADVEAITVYAAQPVALTEEASATIAACPLVALHSARAAVAFSDFVDGRSLPRKNFVLAAFSPAIAKAAGGGWQAIAIAATPTDQELLSAIRALVTQTLRHGVEGKSD